jgi:hypothetical protein
MAQNFQAMLGSRMAGSIAHVPKALSSLFVPFCDYFADLASACQKHQRQFAPVAESKIRSLLRDFLLIGLGKNHSRRIQGESRIESDYGKLGNLRCGFRVESYKAGFTRDFC